MAEADKKPRLRKAPIVRDAIQTKKVARVEAKSPKPLNPLARPFESIFKLLGAILRPIAKVLSWLVPRYFINAWREVRLVAWPSRRETWRLTLAVFVFAIVFGSLIAGVDKGIDEIFKKVVLK